MAAPSIAVIDYGGGNVGSLLAALERRGASFALTGDAAEVVRAGAAILPGDGAFGATMDALRERGLDEAVRTTIAAGRPFLGICVGMQVLFASSDEYGGAAGLGILPEEVHRFEAAPRVPHMGWNELTIEARIRSSPACRTARGRTFCTPTASRRAKRRSRRASSANASPRSSRATT